jgi:hypothetical protein
MYGMIKFDKTINPYVVKCGGVKARNVRIQTGVNSTEGILTLCEVEIFSADPPGESSGEYPFSVEIAS